MSGRIITLGDGRKRHLGGWKRAVARGPRLALKNYVDLSKLEAPVPDCDYSIFPGFTDVLGNDEAGDCTLAGLLHIIMAINAAAGNPVTLTTAQALWLYSTITGYKASDPSTDQGADELTVLDYAAEHGVDGQGLHQILGSVLVDASDKALVRWAVFNLCNVYKGQALPDAYVNPFPASTGTVWDVAGPPNPENGHCTVGLGTTSEGTIDNTWGDKVIQTYAAGAMYCVPSAGGELHTLITRELIEQASQKNPAGTFGLQDLLSDLSKIGALAA